MVIVPPLPIYLRTFPTTTTGDVLLLLFYGDAVTIVCYRFDSRFTTFGLRCGPSLRCRFDSRVPRHGPAHTFTHAYCTHYTTHTTRAATTLPHAPALTTLPTHAVALPSPLLCVRIFLRFTSTDLLRLPHHTLPASPHHTLHLHTHGFTPTLYHYATTMLIPHLQAIYHTTFPCYHDDSTPATYRYDLSLVTFIRCLIYVLITTTPTLLR